MENGNSRRDFLKQSGLGLFGAAALGTLSLSTLKAGAQTKLPMLAESEPMAKTLGYHADATKVDVKKWTKRGAADGKTQFCHNCILFNSGKPTADKAGPCALFPAKSVAANGWCNSWAKNPAAK